MPVPLPPLVVDGLAAAFRLHKLWQAEDPEALLARLAPIVRAIATGVSILAEGVHLPIDAAFMARFPRLEIIANLGVGYDNIDAKWAGDHGIVVTNTPDVLTEETADTAMGLLLCAVGNCRRPIAICAPASGVKNLSRSPPRCAAARWAFSASAGSARRSRAAPRPSA